MNRELTALFLKAAGQRHAAARKKVFDYSTTISPDHIWITDEIVARYRVLDAKVDHERDRCNRWIRNRCHSRGIPVDPALLRP